jgi:hypothetical protein
MTSILSTKEKFDIINKFNESKECDDFNKNYVVEGERTFYEPGFYIVETTYLDVKTNSIIKKQSRHCTDYLRSQACKEAVEKRKKWKKFGDGITDISHLDGGNIVDPVYMEWNPEIFKSKKTQSYMKKYFKEYENGTHNEEIAFNEDKCFGNKIPSIIQEYKHLKEVKETKSKYKQQLDESFNKLINNDIKLSDNNKVEDCSNESTTDGPKLFKVNKSAKNTDTKETAGYVVPHLRQDSTNTETTDTQKFSSVKVSNKDHIKHRSRVSNKKIEKTCIRVLNLPSDANFQSILSTLKPILGRIFFKIKTLNDRRTGKLRDFCFLNFKDEIGGERAFDILTSNKVRIEYAVLNFEWGIKRN